MKKVIIPIIGLLVLLFLTPIILAKITNSNIDKKIVTIEKENRNIQIKEIDKEIGYLTSKRVFKVFYSKNSDIYPIKGVFLVTLNFKNLPSTKAIFNVEIEKFIPLSELKGYKFKVVSKDLKRFEIEGVDNSILEGLKAVIQKDKNYYKIEKFHLKSYSSKNIILKNLDIAGLVKNLELGIVNLDLKSSFFEMRFKKRYLFKGKNIKEHFETHLNSDGTYKLIDKFDAESIGFFNKSKYIGFGTAKSEFVWENYNVDWKFNWQVTEIDNSFVDGGELYLRGVVKALDLRKMNLVIDLNLSKTLFSKVTNPFDPQIVKTYFNGYKTTIKIDDKGIEVNGHRIQ